MRQVTGNCVYCSISVADIDCHFGLGAIYVILSCRNIETGKCRKLNIETINIGIDRVL